MYLSRLLSHWARLARLLIRRKSYAPLHPRSQREDGNTADRRWAKWTMAIGTKLPRGDLPLSLQKCCLRCFDQYPKIWSASGNVSSSGDSKTVSFVERQIT